MLFWPRTLDHRFSTLRCAPSFGANLYISHSRNYLICQRQNLAANQYLHRKEYLLRYPTDLGAG